jgi:threonine dehydrogenase-like Zn-dependent dehydrogenase
MRQAILYAPGDVRVEDREDPRIEKPTDALLRLSATCICGSDLWDYRGVNRSKGSMPVGHEYCGIVEDVGSDVSFIRPGQFVIGSFFASDGTCPNCRNGFQTSCLQRKPIGALGAQAEALRVPWADGTLVATPEVPDDDLVPSLLAASDVLGTGWFAAVAAGVQPGSTVAVVGDGAVGLLGILAAKELGAERIIAMSRHEPRQRLAREFGATDIVPERGDEGVAHVKDLTDGIGAHSVLECVGLDESMSQALRSARPGGGVGIVGVPHGVSVDGTELFYSHVRIGGGPAPVRRFLPDLVERIVSRQIEPGKVFDLTLPLDEAAKGYAAMDDRRAIKVLLQP